MRECWQPDPHKRPSFGDLVSRLDSLQQQSEDSELYVDQMGDNMYDILQDVPGEKC